MDHGRKLSKEEIEQLLQQGKITPVNEIPYLGKWSRVDAFGEAGRFGDKKS